MNVRSAPSSILNVNATTRAQLIQEHRDICMQRRKDDLKYEMTFRNDGPGFGQRTVNVQRMPSVRQFSAPKLSENNSNFHSRDNNDTMEFHKCNNNDDFKRNEDNKKHYDYNSNPFSITRYAEVDRPEDTTKNDVQKENIDYARQRNSNVHHIDMDTKSSRKNEILNENKTVPKSNERVEMASDEKESIKLKKQPPKKIEESVENSNEKKIIKDTKEENSSISDLKFYLNDREYMRKYVMKSIAKNQGTIECYVKRTKKNLGVNIEYSVFLKEGDIFLMSAKKRSKKQTSNYLISLNSADFDRYSENIVGKIRANFVGTEFQIFDEGKNKNRDFIEVQDKEHRKELGVVTYANNMLGNRGPRKMKACINKVDENGNPLHLWQAESKDEEMLNCFKNRIQPAIKNLVCLENKQPNWNELLGSYVLNFYGRVIVR